MFPGKIKVVIIIIIIIIIIITFLPNLLTRTLAFLTESRDEWISSSGIGCQCSDDWKEKENVRQQS